jgi:hypothetical protein
LVNNGGGHISVRIINNKYYIFVKPKKYKKYSGKVETHAHTQSIYLIIVTSQMAFENKHTNEN